MSFRSNTTATSKAAPSPNSAPASGQNQSAAVSPTGGAKSSDASTSSHQSGSHAPAGRPPMHPDSTTPTSAAGDADYTIPLANFDTSKVPLSGAGSGASTGTATPSGYRPGYSSGASTPTESLDGSRHAGQRGSMTSSSKNPKTLLHSSSILGLDKMIEDRKAEGNLTNNVVHMEVSIDRLEIILVHGLLRWCPPLTSIFPSILQITLLFLHPGTIR